MVLGVVSIVFHFCMLSLVDIRVVIGRGME